MTTDHAASLAAAPGPRTLHPIPLRTECVQSDPHDDQLLMAEVARGNQDALRALYDRYAGLVFTVALGTIGDRDIAQEVVQDVFLRCWERAASFNADRGRVHAWLIGITRNRAIDVLRGAQHQARSRDRELLPTDSALPALRHRDHSDEVALNISLQNALALVPEAQRRALELVLLGGLTQREVSEVLSLPLGTVKTRIRDGMVRLRGHLTGASHVDPARHPGVTDA